MFGFSKEINWYNTLDSTWKQVWVDNSGSKFEFSGQYENGIMSMAGNTEFQGSKALFTPDLHNQKEAGTVRQIWKMSKDNGETWNTIFDGTYKPKEN